MIGNVSGAVAHVFRAGDLSAIDATVPVLVDDVYDDFGPGTNTHRVYNFEVADHHTYIADGIRVHNTSVLSHLDPSEFPFIVADSLRDLNGDGSFDSVELDNNKRGVDAVGTTVIKVVEENGELVREDFVTSADEYGRLIFTTYRVDENNKIIEATLKREFSQGAIFGEAVGKIVTPFLSAAILSEDASAFERIATDSILGAFVQSAFEFAGGSIESNIRVNRLSEDNVVTDNLDDIAGITFDDFGVDILQNGVSGLGSLLTQWVMAEIFEGLDPNSFEGKLASTLTNSGVNFIADKTVYYIADNLVGYNPEELRKLGIRNPDFQESFSPQNLGSLALSVAINSLLPAIETQEGQIGSSIASAAVSIFKLAGTFSTYWAPVIGFAVGKFLDALFEEDPEALSTIGYNAFTGQLVVTGMATDDGGNIAISNGMAQGFADFINGIVETAQSKSNNLNDLAQTLNLTFGYIEENFQNGDGVNYSNSTDAVQERIAQAVNFLELKDGDAKVAQGLIGIVQNSGIASRSALLSEIQLRLKIAVDYQAYLEDQGHYDSLIAADPQSAFAAGWAATFLLAQQYGYMNDFNVVGDSTDSIHLTSAGDDFVEAMAGDDEIHTYAGDDTLIAGSGDDSLYGGSGNDSLNGGSGDDMLFGGSGDNTLVGGGGIDQFFIGLGNNTVNGGDGTDLITFDGDYADYTVVDLGANDVTVTHIDSGATSTLSGIEFLRFRDTVRTFDPSYDETVVGTTGDDLLTGTDLRDAINGLDGNDTIYGFDGDDFISGDAGDDNLFGGAGNDWIFGVLGNDVINSGSGNDSSYGGANADFIWGNGGDDSLYGEGSDDVLYGGGGKDLIDGGTGDDLIEGGGGSDTLNGGDGDDQIFDDTGNNTFNGGSGDDQLVGGDGTETFYGGSGDDVIKGLGANDVLYGENGDDIIHGGDGHDTIYGGSGSDTVSGGDGNDVIFVIGSAYANDPFTYVNGLPEYYAAQHFSEWHADRAFGNDGNDIISLNGLGAFGSGGNGDDTFYAHGLLQLIKGGSGYDIVQVQNVQLSVKWYKNENGKIGAILAPSGDLTRATRILDVEKIILASGLEFTPGSNIAISSNEDFDSIFTDYFDAGHILTARTYTDASGFREQVALESDWETFGSGNNSVFWTDGGDYKLNGRQRLKMGDGNDFVSAGNGSDYVKGQDGNDTLEGGIGTDTLEGGTGDDLLKGNSGDDLIYGNIGLDEIDGGAGNDEIYGGGDQDTITGSSGNDTLFGNGGDDEIYGNSGRDSIDGGGGDDILYGNDAPDEIQGNLGNDTIFGGDGSDNLDGSDGDDIVHGGLGLDKILGGFGNDQLHGDEASDEIYGQDGNDTIRGGDSADNLFGGSGDDQIFGGAGNDYITGDDGNDLLSGGAGSDRLDGGLGIDTASYEEATSDIKVNLVTGKGYIGDAEGDLFISIENILGSNHDDGISGDNQDNVLEGYDGNDLLIGMDGDDDIGGGDGDDVVEGGGGQDSISGGSGQDRLAGDVGNDTIFGGSGDDFADGGDGDDVISGELGDDVLTGGFGNDKLNGGEHSDNLSGGLGDDELHGDDGNDVLAGGYGADSIYGGSGNDLIVGGTGDDVLSGGGGRDAFVFTVGDGADLITDFEDGSDFIQIVGWNFDDLIFTQSGNDVDIVAGASDSIKVLNTSLLDITESDFISELDSADPVVVPDPVGAVIGVGLTELETLDLAGYTIETLGNASAGAGLKTLDSGTASGTFTGADGAYTIQVGYLNESDGVSEWEMLVDGQVVNAWIGAGGSDVFETVSVDIDLDQGDEIILQGLRESGEFARLDWIDVTSAEEPVVDDPVVDDPVVVPDPVGAVIGVGLTELETLDLDGYTVEILGIASGGEGIKTLDSGTASGTFTGADGTYTVEVGYLNENDGVSEWELLVEGQVVNSWTGAGGSNTYETASIDVDLDYGDEIVLQGLRESGEFARLDWIDITASSGDPVVAPDPDGALIGTGLTELETLDLDGYTVEILGIASGGEGIKTLDSGTASGTFTGADGTYTVEVGYLNENDGVSEWELLVEGQVVNSWTGAGGSNTYETASIDVDLDYGDEIVLQGLRESGEFARLDWIDIA